MKPRSTFSSCLLAAIITAALFSPLAATGQPSNAPPTTRVEINGISCLFGSKKVALTVIELNPVSHPAKARRALLLAEGDKDGGVEVLAIDEKAETARIRNEGRELTLSLAGVSRPAPPPTEPSPAIASSQNYFLPQPTATAAPSLPADAPPESTVAVIGRRTEPDAPRATSGIIPSPADPGDLQNFYNPGYQAGQFSREATGKQNMIQPPPQPPRPLQPEPPVKVGLPRGLTQMPLPTYELQPVPSDDPTKPWYWIPVPQKRTK